MNDELNLFNPDTMQVDDELKKLSNRNGTKASKAAAARIAPQLKGIKKQILDLLENEPEGLTIFDISDMTGLKLQSVSGRPSELIKKGLIFEYATVVGGSHNKATVYKHVKWKDYLTNPC
jgi:hypothetical protein